MRAVDNSFSYHRIKCDHLLAAERPTRHSNMKYEEDALLRDRHDGHGVRCEIPGLERSREKRYGHNGKKTLSISKERFVDKRADSTCARRTAALAEWAPTVSIYFDQSDPSLTHLNAFDTAAPANGGRCRSGIDRPFAICIPSVRHYTHSIFWANLCAGLGPQEEGIRSPE